MNLTLRRTLMLCMLALILAAMWAGTATAAPKTVDPNTLTPAPDEGVVAECKETGNYIICQTYFDEQPLVNVPVFDLSCGTVYETSNIHREGIRWYSSEGLLLRRFVTEDVQGTWSLSPTGEGPTVAFFAHDNWTDVYAIPGDEESVSTTFHGDSFTAMAPGYGVLFHIAGQDLPNGTHHGAGGAFFIDEEGNVDPEADAALCEALQP
jgi:hypothetical protein